VPHETGLIPLILDGENAWETFHDGGESFLRALYSGIEAAKDKITSCTIEKYFQRNPPKRSLTTLHTGSWIRGNFDIWIGEEEENRAWDLLGQTRNFLQGRLADLPEDKRDRALQEIYAAEGSDWFWWYGPDFSTENDDLFDDLFRQHLKNVYTICDEPVPAVLEAPITRTKVAQVYAMPETLIEPEIDGSLSSYFEWLGAGHYLPGSEQGAMFRSERLLEGIWFGFGAESLYLRFDFLKWGNASLKLVFYEPRGFVLKAGPFGNDGTREFTLTTPGGVELRRNSIARRDILEWEIPLLDLALKPGAAVAFQVRVLVDGIETEQYPESAAIQLAVPGPDFAAAKWIV
jgi:hypothetical protein